MKKLLLCIALLLPFSALADVPVWQTRAQESTIRFVSVENGNPHETRVGDFDADIRFAPDQLDDSRVFVTIPVNDFERDDAEALSTMKEEMFFDAANYPDITFRAADFEHTGDNTYIARGHLKIKDIEMPYDLPFTLDINKNTAQMKAEASVLRLPFQVGKGSWSDTSFIADEVKVRIDLVADKKTP